MSPMAPKNPGMSNGESAHWNHLMSLIPVRSQTWMDEAACAKIGAPDLWFPHPGQVSTESRAVVDVCRGCPVRLDCLQFALDNGEQHGIWGGLTVTERDQLRRGAA